MASSHDNRGPRWVDDFNARIIGKAEPEPREKKPVNIFVLIIVVAFLGAAILVLAETFEGKWPWQNKEANRVPVAEIPEDLEKWERVFMVFGLAITGEWAPDIIVTFIADSEVERDAEVQDNVREFAFYMQRRGIDARLYNIFNNSEKFNQISEIIEIPELPCVVIAIKGEGIAATTGDLSTDNLKEKFLDE